MQTRTNGERPSSRLCTVEIDRCVCFGVRFADLKVANEERSRTFDEITAEFGCGGCCGLCRPYIERMIETGETVFHQILPPAER